jgi:Protein of unknown function (DUF1699).
MKIKIVSSKEEIETLKPSDKIVHLAFRPSNKDIFNMISLCPGLKAIHIPGSYKKTLSGSVLMLLSMQNVELLEGDVWGHRKDLHEFFEIPKESLDLINELKSRDTADGDIISLVTLNSKISTDLARFLVDISSD